MATTRVLVVEDEELFRQMLVSKLSAYQELEIVGEASTGEEAIELAQKLGPEVVLMDIELGGDLNGIQAGKAIRSTAPATGIVVLSSHTEKEFIATVLEGGAAGWSYLLKKNVRDADALVRGITGSAWGTVVVDSQVIEGLKPRAHTPVSRLTEEEIKIIELVAQGYTDAAIAANLDIIDELVVQECLGGIYDALGIESDNEIDPRVKAVVAYLEQTRSR